MIGLGTLGNMALILIGATIGTLIKGGLKKRYQETVMSGLGLAVMFIGISGALEGLLVPEDGRLVGSNIMLMIASLSIGGFIGKLLILIRLDNIGDWLKKTKRD